ncbi:hypothetical protein C2845_PM13G14670 [Panicum miliaceum]|uniref:Uncharacterized protein n=1 Tax=Panicum miliaceum TaxID=4540 RepID=A0A3L6RJC8_PANMI|nr:hypothetical protein C2845_PM13G14670 [Panicum miliaceum]
MDTTQFAMFEELASLTKDNLHSKHLILSTEEALIAALQQLRCTDAGDSDGGEEDGAADTIELQPAGATTAFSCIALLKSTGTAAC